MAQMETVVPLQVDPVQIAPGVAIAPQMTITVVGDPPGTKTEIEAAYQTSSGRVVVVAVRVSRLDDGSEVTAALLRSVRVQEWIQAAAVHHVYSGSASEGWTRMTREGILARVRSAESSSDRVTAAALMYSIAVALSDGPLKAVGEALGVSQSTATRLVAQARARGLLRG